MPGSLSITPGFNFRGCQCHNSIAWTIANDGADHAVLWDTNDFDTDGMHSTSVNTNRITINTAGYYEFSGAVGMIAQGVGVRLVALRNSAATKLTQVGQGAVTAQDTDWLIAPRVVKCAVADWFDLSVLISGATGTVTTYPTLSFFQAIWLGY